VYSGTNKKSPSEAKNTKDTIQKKLFLKVILRIFVFVFQPKKSQPYFSLPFFHSHSLFFAIFWCCTQTAEQNGTGLPGTIVNTIRSTALIQHCSRRFGKPHQQQ
jgi:hypothetical protein